MPWHRVFLLTGLVFQDSPVSASDSFFARHLTLVLLVSMIVVLALTVFWILLSIKTQSLYLAYIPIVLVAVIYVVTIFMSYQKHIAAYSKINSFKKEFICSAQGVYDYVLIDKNNNQIIGVSERVGDIPFTYSTNFNLNPVGKIEGTKLW